MLKHRQIFAPDTRPPRSRLITELLESIPEITWNRGHDKKLYKEALGNRLVFAVRYLCAGSDSIVFDRGQEVVKLTARPFFDEYGLRPFDIPITEKVGISVREGVVVTVFVQPKAVMSCCEPGVTNFRLEIEKEGYKFIDYGITQVEHFIVL